MQKFLMSISAITICIVGFLILIIAAIYNSIEFLSIALSVFPMGLATYAIINSFKSEKLHFIEKNAMICGYISGLSSYHHRSYPQQDQYYFKRIILDVEAAFHATSSLYPYAPAKKNFLDDFIKLTEKILNYNLNIENKTRYGKLLKTAKSFKYRVEEFDYFRNQILN